jgi:hypothetical protein
LNQGESIFIGGLRVTFTGVIDRKVYLGIASQQGESGFSSMEGKLDNEIFI